ncbi:uncharacterized protein BYT42DRAFT_552262 [Radiomyces spectabilis]|uniref:uncharacterized protein n=1 Tax=Radiomyces spectabilis TaxID=64574 RepID=UPI00221EE371|nr:uncharacterized protein BYT42DRAFT_552262 [Radiomyces spectabilis]KAI8393797.1 hypothetical protein BYT42DRAFT_552262 [Radiomyces spectabilis]
MVCFMQNPTLDASIFKNAYLNRDQPVDWDRAYDGFTAAVDWPTCAFYKELMVKYPDAKILLTERDADSWYKSVKNTIYQRARESMENHDYPPNLAQMGDMARTVVLDGAFNDPELFANEEEMKRRFLEHNAEVKRTVPADRLLVIQLGEGWNRLCEFLGKPVPNVPYPNTNSTENFHDLVTSMQKKEIAVSH